MKKTFFQGRRHRVGLFLAFFFSVRLIQAQEQVYRPANWVNDPFCLNPNFGVAVANTANPSYTNNGVQRGTVYGNSSIGEKLTLVNPGDTILCTGQVELMGDVNTDGNMQFRVGLFYQSTNKTDTNWMGYVVGNPTGAGWGGTNALYVRKSGNVGIYASGSAEQATRPPCEMFAYNAGWTSGTYKFSLTVTKMASDAQQISWNLSNVLPNSYNYAGAYTNLDAATQPESFDQVGFLGGAALFNSPSTADRISFKDVTVVLRKQSSVR